MKLSVIVPCYNSEEYVERTILSLLNQVGKIDFEIILIDDFSIDNTFLLISQKFQNISNIKILRNFKNMGVSYTRNIGILEARGDYLLFLDSDDIYDPNLFETLIPYLEEIDFLAFGFEKEIPDGVKYFANKKLNKKKFTSNEFISIFLNREVVISMCSFCVKRSIVLENEIVFDVETFSGEDQEFEIMCIMRSKSILYLKDVLFTYKYNSKSFMNLEFNKRRITSLTIYDKLKEKIWNRYKSRNISNQFNTFSILEYFSVLRDALSSGSSVDIKEVESYNSIIDTKIYYSINSQFCKVFILKVFYKLSRKNLYKFLKKR